MLIGIVVLVVLVVLSFRLINANSNNNDNTNDDNNDNTCELSCSRRPVLLLRRPGQLPRLRLLRAARGHDGLGRLPRRQA